LVQTGILASAKKFVPHSLRQKLAGALYSDKNIPALQEADANWLREYYQEEVGNLSELLGIDITEKWPEFGR